MGDEPATQSDLTAEGRSDDASDGATDDSADEDVGDRDDRELVQDIVEGEAEPETSWIADGEKYRCPDCEAVHEEPAGGCRVCGWVPG